MACASMRWPPTYIATPLNEFVKSKPEMYNAWIGGTPMARLGEGRGDCLGRAVPGLGRRQPVDRQHRGSPTAATPAGSSAAALPLPPQHPLISVQRTEHRGNGRAGGEQASLHRGRCRHGERQGRHLRPRRHDAGDCPPSDPALARARRHRRAILRGHLAGLRHRDPLCHGRGEAVAGGDRRDRLRRHLLAGRPRRGREAADGQPLRRSAAQRHRLDGSPRDPAGGAHQQDRPSGAAPCRRGSSRRKWRRRRSSG